LLIPVVTFKGAPQPRHDGAAEGEASPGLRSPELMCAAALVVLFVIAVLAVPALARVVGALVLWIRIALGAGVRTCTHKIGDNDLINVRFGPLCGLKSDIPRGPRSADIVAKVF
jgi:hypothetical protein